MDANSAPPCDMPSKKSFLDLPPELRNAIYELVTKTYRKPSSLYPAERVEVDTGGRIKFPQNVLGATCRKVHEEYTPIYKRHVQSVSTLVADIDEFRFQSIIRRLEKLFPSTSVDTSSGKRQLVLSLSFEDPEYEPDVELLVKWLEHCEKSDLMASFGRRYYVSFEWNKYDVRDVSALQDKVQDQMIHWRGQEEYVRILHATLDAAGEREPAYDEGFGFE